MGDPAWFAILESDLHQGIGKALAELGVTHHLAQLGIFKRNFLV